MGGSATPRQVKKNTGPPSPGLGFSGWVFVRFGRVIFVHLSFPENSNSRAEPSRGGPSRAEASPSRAEPSRAGAGHLFNFPPP